MKILMREWYDKSYQWVDATYDEANNRFRYNSNIINEANIVSVFEDNRNEFVKCSKCGQSFKKGSAEAKAHLTPIKDTSKCFDCPRARASNPRNLVTKYELIDGNIYKAMETSVVNMMCSASYPYTGIHEEVSRTRCIYNQCVGATMREFSDFFTENPEVFDAIITTDAVEAVGYVEKYNRCGDLQYKLNVRNTVWAVSNKLGIIDHFAITYRRETYTVYYSKKYNKLFYVNGGKYQPWDPYNMPESSKQLILNKIAELYS